MATVVNNGNDSPPVAPSAAAATNDEAGFSSFAEFEAQMSKDENPTSSAATIQNDGGVLPTSQIKPPEEDPATAAATDDADDTEITDDTTTPVTGEPAKGPAKANLKTRLGQLVRERHEADARERAALDRAEAAEARARELETGAKPTAKAAPNTDQRAPVTDDTRPKAEDFEFGEYDPDYQDALVEWRVEQSIAKREAKSTEQTQQQAAREAEAVLTQKWGGVIEKGAAAMPDFEDKVLKSTSGWKLSKQMWEMAVDSDVGHDVLYHLASDPAESSRVFDLPLTRQAAEFGKLEARFSQPSGERPKAGSKDGAAGHMPSAPKPMSQTRGAGGQFKPDAGTKDFAAFEAMMQAEEAARTAKR